MPGHKGKAPLPCGFESAYLYDITEIHGADALFEAEDIIAESEKNTAKLFGTGGTVFSCSGSTSCIQAMLASVLKPGDTVAAARNAHRAFINSCALLDLNVEWIYPESSDTIISGRLSPENAEKVLSDSHASALYVTSPDYLGAMADIKALSEICRKHSAFLLCDNAHGAYTAFLEKSLHPIALGADMCCDSAHKTLPALTGAAFLHTADPALARRAKENMSVFCSTSPSYLILQSMDLCNAYLAGNFKEELCRTVKKIQRLKSLISPPYELYGDEPLKLTIHSSACGTDGRALADILRENRIECEFADRSYTVLMLSPFNTDEEFDRIRNVLQNVKMPRIRIDDTPPKLPVLARGMSLRKAMFSPCEYVPIKNTVGRICGRTVTVCPPAVAAAVPGEIISSEAADILESMDIKGLNVVK